MIRFTHGDLLDSGCDLLVNPVNCVGVSGRGLARQFAEIFAECVPAYQRACRNGELRPGTILVVGPVLFFPTKRHWKGYSLLADVDRGLLALRRLLHDDRSIRSIAIPPLGCGLGGLPWSAVRPLIIQHLGDLPLEILVYQPPAGTSRR